MKNIEFLKKICNFKIEKVKDIDWCFCIINRKKFKNSKILDENFFMYFETIDLCKKLEKLKHRMLIIKGLKFRHLGTSSSHKKFNNEILINRNWHFSWSKFYFLKKNQNYIYALKKIIPNVYKNTIGIIISLLKINLFDARLNLASLMGALNGIFLRKSSYRINLKMTDNNLKMFCLTLEPNHLSVIEQMSYIPVGLGEKNFPQNCFSDKSGNNISKKISIMGSIHFIIGYGKTI